MDYINRDADLYIEEWTRMMLVIWRDRVERLKVVRTGAFHESFSSLIRRSAEGQTLSMKFLKYGIYQALGVGYGYAHGNGGDLPFLDKNYRREHGLDKPKKVGPRWGGDMTSGNPRVKRDWFSRALYVSARNMIEDLARIGGEKAASMLCDALTDTRSVL